MKGNKFNNYQKIYKMSKDGYELAGQNAQGYVISKAIGQGKFSIVYRAEKEGVPYALKKIKIFDMGDQKQRQKCLKQVDLMRPLDHPNIIKYIDSFIHNNELIIVTEWADKGDLKKLIKDYQSQQMYFQQSTIWEYMRQISSALKQMHEKRIMHRDLKPANIFISQDSTLKIGDLGLGRIFGAETLEAYSKVGTPLYMSPELIKDTGYNMNADVWSLGCICYELAELNSPFRNKQEKMSLLDLFDNITRCNYKPINSRYSPQLSKVIKQMIVVDPNKRLSSEQVYEIAVHNIENVKKNKIDCFMVMQDIHIKLNLLNYSFMFCKYAQKKPIHKFYFAIKDSKSQQSQQLYYFLELCYWVIGLAKPDNRKQKLPIYTKTMIDWKSPQSACRKLFVDINGIGIKFENINVESVLQGFGESVCYLLNEILNRELVRLNFQFGQPKNMVVLKNEQEEFICNNQEASEELEQQNKMQVSSESLEEQSQFQQSIFYRKNKKDKINNQDVKLLQKIQQFDDDEDRNIIIGQVDEREWRIQCSKLEKQLHDINQIAKDARKKEGFQNYQITKICASKMADLVKYLKPTTTGIAMKIQQDLEKIGKGEARINRQFERLKEQYIKSTRQFKQLNYRSIALSESNQHKMLQYANIQQKRFQIQAKIQSFATESQNNSVSDLKKGIEKIRKEIKQMDLKKEIIMWQILKKKRSLTKQDYLNMDLIDDQ